MIKINRGVSIVGVKPEMVLATSIVESVYDKYDSCCTITSGTEQPAPHKPDSLHWTGFALDYRIRTIPKFNRQPLANEIAEALGTEFDVVLHTTHLHVEHDPA